MLRMDKVAPECTEGGRAHLVVGFFLVTTLELIQNQYPDWWGEGILSTGDGAGNSGTVTRGVPASGVGVEGEASPLLRV